MESQTNTLTSASNERPPNGICEDCKVVCEPYFRPAIGLLGIDGKWLSPSKLCEPCADKREYQLAEMERIKRERDNLEKAFKSARISPRFRERTFENYKPTDKTKKAFDAANSYSPEGDGLVFFGPCGTGKTHLAASIVNRFIGRIPVLFVSCPELLIEIRESMNGNKGNNSLEAAKDVRLLVVDDIGAEKTSEWVRETLFVLINHRYEYKLPTIFTTNCSMSQLSEKLGDRIASRLVEMCRMINVAGDDYRLGARV